MMRVLMLPVPNPDKPGKNGIARVVEAYYRYLPDYGVTLVPPEANDYDLVAAHIKADDSLMGGPLVLHNHGLHWSADYACTSQQYHVNGEIVKTLRHAREVTVPSAWVAETFQRDMRISPHIVPHAIDWFDWGEGYETGDYILWNKNRPGDVCDPTPILELARHFTDQHFVTTYLPPGAPTPNNTNVIGSIPHKEMRKMVQSSLVYLSTTKETFGIGVLEAMASGVPVLGVAHGGNVDLIEHGVTGYLAQPGNFDDLAEGLAYCLRYRDVLGDNGREVSRRYSWRPIAAQVADIYRQALEPDPPTVAVVIPVYNKTEEELERAIRSARDQVYDRITQILVVDDGTPERDYSECVANHSISDDRVGLIRTRNSGVANARNKGIAETGSTKYICCIDADDEIGPEFIETCVAELEKDPSIGITYTAIMDVFPDGRRMVSQWPPEFDYDQQLKGRNQVPTCCVFRRKMWERLGGYNQKYAPDGQGAEDAEFWLRAGAYGFKAKKVTDQPLFIYHLGGAVTGNPHYQEPDWLQMHPWTRDGLHPFASIAKPVKMSHPVRQYDEPAVSVVIPVGPGHVRRVRDALDSLEAQTFRKWEVIVVFDTGTKDADTVGPEVGSLLTAYPYIRWHYIALREEPMGAGYARNRGVEIARAPFLFFLDADDGLGPECLEKHLNAWREHQMIVYSDYVGMAYVENTADLDPVLQGRLYDRNDRTKECIIGYKAADYDCERAILQPEPRNPYLWCNVTALVPKVWHDDISGFDEQMPSWEDVDYHWRLAKRGYCYYHIPEELMVYQFHTGNRRERGRQDFEKLLQYLSDKHERIRVMPCSSCGGRRNRTTTVPASTPTAQRAQAVTNLSDDDFVKAQYIGSKGNHQVTGAALFERRLPGVRMISRGAGWSIDYGRQAGGRVFLVHKDDIRLMPGKFIPVVENIASTAPPPPKAPPPEPEPLRPPVSQTLKETPDYEPPPANTYPPPPEPITAEDDGAERAFDFQRIPGVGPTLAAQFAERGIVSKLDVLKLGADGLRQFDGVGEKKAELIIKALEDAD